MKDYKGGTIQLVAGVVGGVCTVIGINSFLNNDGSISYAIPVVLGIGLGLELFNFVYNIVRSVSYQKPIPTIATGFDPQALNITVLPSKNWYRKCTTFLYHTVLRFYARPDNYKNFTWLCT
jgi:hypothetical protein